MKRPILYSLVAIACLAALHVGPISAASAQGQSSSFPNRLIVLTDIEADPDDTQTLIRLLLYANEIDIKGLIATTSIHQRTRVAPQTIRTVINAYDEIYPNLKRHAPGYPAARSLQTLVKQGLPEYGMDAVGDGKDSEGSEWIISILEEDDDRPLWVSVWGGANTLAQALYKIRQTRSEAEARRLVQKLRVYTISDQDDSGIWMRRNFPELFYIVSPGGYGAGAWTAINTVVPGTDNEEISNKWLVENIQQDHGPLGALYPDVAYGMEGDTPAWLSLIPNGLNEPERPDWGGWGGRYEFYRPELSAINPDGFTGGVPVEDEPRAIWTNATDSFTPWIENEYGRAVRQAETTFTDFRAPLWRWRKDFQNDFAARLDWTTESYEGANHPPSPALGHPSELTVKGGDSILLNANGSSDPDGDSLSFLWFHYPEPGTLDEVIRANSAENSAHGVHFIAPEVDETKTAHFILRVTDKGSPPLSRYKRVIVTIEPK